MEVAKAKIQQFLDANPGKHARSMDDMTGEWELVLTTVKHGIFRSSPFFLAIQEAFSFAEVKGMSVFEMSSAHVCTYVSVDVCTKIRLGLSPLFSLTCHASSRSVVLGVEAFGEDKAELFFKLHLLQTCSFGISTVNRVRIKSSLATRCLCVSYQSVALVFLSYQS